jgi:DNA-binding response OmpR family regulator
VNEPGDSSAQLPASREIEVLIVEPDKKIAVEITSALEEAVPGTRVRVATSFPEAQRAVLDQRPALFVLDIDATWELGQEFIYDLRTTHPDARAIILTAIHFTACEQMRGLGAIDFLEKPFPRSDFIALVEALLAPAAKTPGAATFHATLSDLHLADIIQLKCISGATSLLEFTNSRDEKARVYFENGQVRHAICPGNEGRAAFDEIVVWRGGKITEIPVPSGTPHTIHLDWQILLMEAVRKMDESRGAQAEPTGSWAPPGKTVLVIDDSMMLLSFVRAILEEQGYKVLTAENGEEGLRLAKLEAPDLILLDFVLPDIRGDQVSRQLLGTETSSKIPVVYVSGFGADLQADPTELPNVIGALGKPFTSEALLAAVRLHLDRGAGLERLNRENGTRDSLTQPAVRPGSALPKKSESPVVRKGSVLSNDASDQVTSVPVETKHDRARTHSNGAEATAATPSLPTAPESSEVGAAQFANVYFCGDSSFFPLDRALRTIAQERLTGVLRALWKSDCVELLARDGGVLLVTTRNRSLYCEEPPEELSNIPPECIEAARSRQAEDGCPFFLTLANEGAIARLPGLQLMQDYGQRLFSKLWTERVRFRFEQNALPDYASEISTAPDHIDQWALNTLRRLESRDLKRRAMGSLASLPAYTRDGLERVQRLRLTTEEVQCASQFNGNRSIARIAKNLRLDENSSRLMLFRFLALEIVECWPAHAAKRTESRKGFGNLFVR